MGQLLARSSSRARLVLVLVLVTALSVALAVVGAATPAGAGGDSETSRCQKGGWQHLYTEAGEPFRNQGHCTSYAARGGELRESPPPPPARTLTIDKVGTGSGTVSSRPAGIDCGPDCSQSYPDGTTVTVTAAPSSGSTFTGWSGACSGTTPACEVVLTGDTTATATFAQTPPPPFRTPVIHLAYEDTIHDGGGVRLRPWQGDPDIVFVGCTRGDSSCGEYDAGVIRVDNSAENTRGLTLLEAHVDIGPCRFRPWGALLPATAGPGHSLILTQTGLFGPPQPSPCDALQGPDARLLYNFFTAARPGDSLEPRHFDCDPADRLTPVITLRFSDGPTLTVTDTHRVLNTGGATRFACTGLNHATPWTLVDPADVVATR